MVGSGVSLRLLYPRRGRGSERTGPSWRAASPGTGLVYACMPRCAALLDTSIGTFLPLAEAQRRRLGTHLLLDNAAERFAIDMDLHQHVVSLNLSTSAEYTGYRAARGEGLPALPHLSHLSRGKLHSDLDSSGSLGAHWGPTRGVHAGLGDATKGNN